MSMHTHGKRLRSACVKRRWSCAWCLCSALWCLLVFPLAAEHALAVADNASRVLRVCKSELQDYGASGRGHSPPAECLAELFRNVAAHSGLAPASYELTDVGRDGFEHILRDLAKATPGECDLSTAAVVRTPERWAAGLGFTEPILTTTLRLLVVRPGPVTLVHGAFSHVRWKKLLRYLLLTVPVALFVLGLMVFVSWMAFTVLSFPLILLHAAPNSVWLHDVKAKWRRMNWFQKAVFCIWTPLMALPLAISSTALAALSGIWMLPTDLLPVPALRLLEGWQHRRLFKVLGVLTLVLTWMSLALHGAWDDYTVSSLRELQLPLERTGLLSRTVCTVPTYKSLLQRHGLEVAATDGWDYQVLVDKLVAPVDAMWRFDEEADVCAAVAADEVTLRALAAERSSTDANVVHTDSVLHLLGPELEQVNMAFPLHRYFPDVDVHRRLDAAILQMNSSTWQDCRQALDDSEASRRSVGHPVPPQLGVFTHLGAESWTRMHGVLRTVSTSFLVVGALSAAIGLLLCALFVRLYIVGGRCNGHQRMAGDRSVNV